MTRRARMLVSLVLAAALSVVGGVLMAGPQRFGVVYGAWTASATWTGKPTSDTFPNGPFGIGARPAAGRARTAPSPRAIRCAPAPGTPRSRPGTT